MAKRKKSISDPPLPGMASTDGLTPVMANTFRIRTDGGGGCMITFGLSFGPAEPKVLQTTHIAMSTHGLRRLRDCIDRILQKEETR